MAWMHRVARLALAAGVTLAGCSPNAPTDGFFGCSSSDPGQCPSAFPYCQSDGRCHSTAETDTGPRPDTGPVDAFVVIGSGEYLPCGAPPMCGPGLSCIGGSCMTACGGSCPDGRQCVPPSTMDATTACVPSCNGGAACPAGTSRRVVMGTMCQCAPASWPH